MPLNMAFLNQSGGIELSLSDGSSSIQRKIEVAQQVLTVLEDTMSTAKSMHLRVCYCDNSFFTSICGVEI